MRMSFKLGTKARKARGRVAERLKERGMSADRAFAIATASTKRMSRGARERLAKRRGRRSSGRR